MANELTIALTGNPNVGKSTVFNALTGSRQHVGNWPGKTVEKKSGTIIRNDRKIIVTDLPGTYSLTAYSEEEVITRDFIIKEKPDVVIDIIDSANIERNLYLTVQLLELESNLIIALNMSDSAKNKGIKINRKKIEELLGVPVIEIQANKEKGIEKLIEKAVIKAGKKGKNPVSYGNELDEHIKIIEEKIRETDNRNAKWTAIKLLERDKEIEKKTSGELLEIAEKERKHLEDVFGRSTDAAITDARYAFIAGLMKETVAKTAGKTEVSEKIDFVLTNPLLGLPIFLLFMFIAFQLTFVIAQPFADAIDYLFSEIIAGLALSLLENTVPKFVLSFVVNGLISGIGSVLVFVPFIFMLFAVIAVLEDSSYMARAAFITDRFMHKIGLHGKSFLPMLLGFGCTVPAVMATRTLDNKRDRILTIMIMPFMSCGAKLPIYVLFAAAFFPKNADLVVYSLYLAGILVAIVMGLILNKFVFKGLSSPLVMELPPYRMPALKGIIIHAWERAWLFIRKAGTIIFAMVIILWLLASIPLGVEYGSEESAIGTIGKTISPVFEPLGFGNWQSAVALLFGVFAKEASIAAFGTLYGVTDVESAEGEVSLIANLQNNFSPLSAYAFLIFLLLYVPCIPSLTVIKREIGTKWVLFIIFYTTTVAWIASFLVYNLGMLAGFG